MSGALDVVTKCFVNSARKNLAPSSLSDSLTAAGVEEELVGAVVQCYSDNREILVETVKRATVQVRCDA